MLAKVLNRSTERRPRVRRYRFTVLFLSSQARIGLHRNLRSRFSALNVHSAKQPTKGNGLGRNAKGQDTSGVAPKRRWGPD